MVRIHDPNEEPADTNMRGDGGGSSRDNAMNNHRRTDRRKRDRMGRNPNDSSYIQAMGHNSPTMGYRGMCLQ